MAYVRSHIEQLPATLYMILGEEANRKMKTLLQVLYQLQHSSLDLSVIATLTYMYMGKGASNPEIPVI